MKGTKNPNGTYTLEDGSIVDEVTFNSQLTDADKVVEEPVKQVPSMIELKALVLEEENKRLKEALERKAAQSIQAPIAQAPLEAGDTFNKPQEFFDRIAKMVEAQIAPLRQSQVAFDKQQAYGQLKMRLKQQQPQNAQALGFLEPLIDQFMEGREPTEANFAECLQRAIGAAALSNPSLFSRNAAPATNTNANTDPNQQPKPVNNSMTIPPHLRPSSASAGSNADPIKVDMSQFDENEKRLMRENGQTPAQYVMMRDAPSSELTSKKFQDAYKAAGAK